VVPAAIARHSAFDSTLFLQTKEQHAGYRLFVIIRFGERTPDTSAAADTSAIYFADAAHRTIDFYHFTSAKQHG